MPTAFELLKQKSIQMPPQEAGGASAFDLLRQKSGASSVSQETLPEVPKKDGILKTIIKDPIKT